MLQQSEKLLAQGDKASTASFTPAAEVTISLQERIIAEQAARIAASEALIANLQAALDTERGKSIHVAPKSKGILERTGSVFAYVGKQSRIVLTQVFWIAAGYFFGSSGPAFYKANMNAVWTAGFMTIYVGFFAFIMLRMAQYVYRTLRKAYEDSPVAFSNLLLVYGVITALAGVLEQATSRSSVGDSQMIWMTLAGVTAAGFSLLYGRAKAKESGVRFPDLLTTRKFM